MTRENKVKIFILSFFFINIPFLLFVERPISADTAIDSQNSVANAYIMQQLKLSIYLEHQQVFLFNNQFRTLL